MVPDAKDQRRKVQWQDTLERNYYPVSFRTNQTLSPKERDSYVFTKAL